MFRNDRIGVEFMVCGFMVCGLVLDVYLKFFVEVLVVLMSNVVLINVLCLNVWIFIIVFLFMLVMLIVLVNEVEC